MPRSLLSEDRATYADGAALTSFTRLLVRADIEEESSLIACTICGTMFLYLLHLLQRWSALRRPSTPVNATEQTGKSSLITIASSQPPGILNS